MSNDADDIDLSPQRRTPRRGDVEPRHYTVVVGYVGEGSTDDLVRIYINEAMSSYYEVAVSDIAGTQQVDRDDPDSPRRVSIRSDAQVRVVRVDEMNGPASYIEGALRAKYSARLADLKVQPPWGRTEIFFFCPTPISITDATTGTWPCSGTDVWPQCGDCC